MVTFLDGPAEGEQLALRRIPELLRVVRSSSGKSGRGKWDALDQLEDEPQPTETIVVYLRCDDPQPTWYHVCSRGRGRRESGRYWQASYRVLPEQPADELVRTTAAWRAWATDKMVELYGAPVLIPLRGEQQETR